MIHLDLLCLGENIGNTFSIIYRNESDIYCLENIIIY